MKATIFETVTAVICTAVTFLFGAWDIALVVLLAFITLDYLTGVACGIVRKELSSAVGARGLLKKAIILVIIIVAVLLDRLIGTEWVIRSAVCYFYIANEGISIVENAAALGLPIPKKLIDVLKQLKDKGDKDKNDDDIQKD